MLADPNALRIETFVSHENSITIVVHSIQAQPLCPLCLKPSNHLHSNYIRQITDLPWHGVAVSLELHTRKFRCRNQDCLRKVFCERLPNVVAAMGRKTCRLNSALTFLAFALGGEAGARTARKLNLQISGTSLLRRIRQSSLNQTPEVKILGVDDFAFRRGERYGTILIDLESRQPIDLLPDRETLTFQNWLEQHPEVKLISRDRGYGYAAGARAGAPQAEQVADRFHLLKNLLDGFEEFLSRQHQAISTAFQAVFRLPLKTQNSNCPPLPTNKPLTKAQQLLVEQKQARHAAHERHFQTVKELHHNGTPILRIARQLQMSRNTVKKFLKCGTAPPRQPQRQRYSPIHPFVPFLRQRWSEGERNARKLWKEIKEKGYPGAEETLRHFLQKWRTSEGGEVQTRSAVKDSAGRAPSAKQTKWLLFGSDKKIRKPWETEFLQQLCQNSSEIVAGQSLIKEFHQIMMSRQEQSTALQSWLARVRASGIGELVWFANGVEQDRAAVKAACSSRWSQGQVEGQVNRLKFLKRQVYGRAKFDLLRARVLYQS